MRERSECSPHSDGGEALAPKTVRPPTQPRCAGKSELVLSLADYARALGESPDALRAVVVGKAGKRGFAQFDGHEFWKEEGDWLVRIRGPWLKRGALRRWIPAVDAARIRGLKPQTLRRKLQRHLISKSGVRMARFEGGIACKFSRIWRVCLVGKPAKHG